MVEGGGGGGGGAPCQLAMALPSPHLHPILPNSPGNGLACTLAVGQKMAGWDNFLQFGMLFYFGLGRTQIHQLPKNCEKGVSCMHAAWIKALLSEDGYALHKGASEMPFVFGMDGLAPPLLPFLQVGTIPQLNMQ